jgi:hypothetical protein
MRNWAGYFHMELAHRPTAHETIAARFTYWMRILCDTSATVRLVLAIPRYREMSISCTLSLSTSSRRPNDVPSLLHALYTSNQGGKPASARVQLIMLAIGAVLRSVKACQSSTAHDILLNHVIICSIALLWSRQCKKPRRSASV